MIIDKALSTPGERLKRARALAGLRTRHEVAKKYSISANTLQGWEQDKNPLTAKGAQRIVDAFKWEGLLCTVKWLLKGTGMPPCPCDMLNVDMGDVAREKNLLSEQNIREEEVIYREIQLFKEKNVNSIILTITDDAMEPYYHVGDHVGGVQLYNGEIEHVLGNLCIVELDNNQIMPRLLQKTSKVGRYNVCCTNPTTDASPLNDYDVTVVSAAPVLWHRRKMSAL